MTKEQRDTLAEHGPYTFRQDDGWLIDRNGVALARLVVDGGEPCDWDRALVAALNEIASAHSS